MPSAQVWEARHSPTGCVIRVSDGVRVNLDSAGYRGIVRDIRAYVAPDDYYDPELSAVPETYEGSDWVDEHGRPICHFRISAYHRMGHIDARKVEPLPEMIPDITYGETVESTEGPITFCSGPPPRKASVA